MLRRVTDKTELALRHMPLAQTNAESASRYMLFRQIYVIRSGLRGCLRIVQLFLNECFCVKCFLRSFNIGIDARGSSDGSFTQTAGAQGTGYDDRKQRFERDHVACLCLHYGVAAVALIGLISPQAGPSHRALDEIVVVVGWPDTLDDVVILLA